MSDACRLPAGGAVGENGACGAADGEARHGAHGTGQTYGSMGAGRQNGAATNTAAGTGR